MSYISPNSSDLCVNVCALCAVSPTILKSPVPVSVFAPAPITLTCTADGYPLPTTVWIRTSLNGTEMIDSSVMNDVLLTQSVTGFSVTSNLTLLNTDELDTGNWSCRASNNFGFTESQTAEVVIYCKLYSLSCMIVHYYVLANVTGTVDCEVCMHMYV